MSFYISKLKEKKELEIIHKCLKFISEFDNNDGEEYTYGSALDNLIYYNKYHNNFLMTNDEYSVIVKFCPYCGLELKK